MKRTLPNGREAEVIPLTFGRARLCLISRMWAPNYDDAW